LGDNDRIATTLPVLWWSRNLEALFQTFMFCISSRLIPVQLINPISKILQNTVFTPVHNFFTNYYKSMTYE